MRHKLRGKSGRASPSFVCEAWKEPAEFCIDTANKYNGGGNESMLGEFLESDRDHFFVAPNYTFFTRQGDPNACG